jgi:TRAP-type mannitol/chloroaromatic compound transport system substrate-binding protein
MTTIDRRNFIKKAALLAAAGSSALVSACSKNDAEQSAAGAPAVITGKKFRWKMVTTWPPKFPVLGEGAELFAKWVDEMSGGQLQIRVFGGGELVPALEAFDSVSQGAAEMAHGASYYWAGKAPASQFFCAVPFGMNAQQMNAWLISGGGLKLWEDLYAQFNLVPFPCGNTGVQMGGWFRKKINSMEDIKGLKMRIPGLGGKVISKAGGTAVLSAGGEIFTNLERNVIDATEWIGPYHDYLMGFPKVAPYYYYPGWHEPSAVLELFVNKPAFESLSKHLQEIIRTAAYRANNWILAEFESKNEQYLQKILAEHQTTLLKFPDEVLRQLRKYADEAIAEVVENDSYSKKVYEAYQAFRKRHAAWSDISEKVYYSDIAG